MMKTYATISIAVIGVLLMIIGSQVMSQKKQTKVDAFHESLTHENSGNYAKAIQALDAVYKDNKDDYLLNLRLGWVNYLAKNYDASAQFYSQAFTLSGSKSIDALLGKTYPLSARNDWDAVAAAYHSVLKLDPANYTANLRLGQIMLNRGLYAEAKSYLEKAQVHYPGSYEPNLSLGWTYYYLGNRQKARSLLTAALMLSPGDTLALQGLKLLK